MRSQILQAMVSRAGTLMWVSTVVPNFKWVSFLTSLTYILGKHPPGQKSLVMFGRLPGTLLYVHVNNSIITIILLSQPPPF